jgi:hypothetical protein
MKCRLPDGGTKGRRIHFSFAVIFKTTLENFIRADVTFLAGVDRN